MSYERVDFDGVVQFDGRMLGSVGDVPHTNTGPAQFAAPARPQLSLVPLHERFDMESDDEDDDQWQERGLCAQTDPEAFFPEKGGSTREAKRICQGCEVRDRCLEYALANDERFGIWGGLSERERRRLKRGIV
ncbi:transcriptional regulator WhiB2 [Mycolicibacterium arabiense]|uniref:Transcriptional regulator WhiB n=2 Tax=Mycolicibacterium arabiense TaxID=1286181 RepID=A0A7I7RXM6_9MYCO|nr:transcriptional regulator WhiB2 [Mycolicibacterium arabiense]